MAITNWRDSKWQALKFELSRFQPYFENRWLASFHACQSKASEDIITKICYLRRQKQIRSAIARTTESLVLDSTAFSYKRHFEGIWIFRQSRVHSPCSKVYKLQSITNLDIYCLVMDIQHFKEISFWFFTFSQETRRPSSRGLHSLSLTISLWDTLYCIFLLLLNALF